ncbi:MAG: Low specificity L-threonine aldolase [Burkholderia lata]|uniref:Low specificity L-threonine aldolase n=1 Tax=Burkholderia lata (strain ATCC 17760 / DSM 23089 / LMG 22485 / NCIMB 9086 / R18194 / 383) TaxID=482957 RepID=A0A833PSK1_BURL3|nr:low-specificity L-threonine aldolase [Burkholderia lata]KAF1036138.1 MAG: Low specificity L-threonine aldolase [Burkholderia lata]
MIDLRSDTVTQPVNAMRAAMAAASVGDDVYGEDPTVNHLQERMADELAFERALFSSSGTQSNLLALLAHCERGDEYIAGQDAHTYRFEGGGAAVLGSIQPQPIEAEPDGSLAPDRIVRAIKPEGDAHFARTRLLCLENTTSGRVLSLSYLENVCALASGHGLSLHLDGARLYNAAIASDVDARSIARHFDSVSVCLSKGLGAPVGAVLCGSNALIEKAQRWRKVLGGGMRQCGMLAAAGLYALDHHVARLKIDHDNAARLASGLAGLEGLTVDSTPTNMLFLSGDEHRLAALKAWLAIRDILVSGRYGLRLVTHLGISSDDVDFTIEAVRDFWERD